MLVVVATLSPLTWNVLLMTVPGVAPGSIVTLKVPVAVLPCWPAGARLNRVPTTGLPVLEQEGLQLPGWKVCGPVKLSVTSNLTAGAMVLLLLTITVYRITSPGRSHIYERAMNGFCDTWSTKMHSHKRDGPIDTPFSQSRRVLIAEGIVLSGSVTVSAGVVNSFLGLLPAGTFA